MARGYRIHRRVALLALLAVQSVQAQQTTDDLPNLSTVATPGTTSTTSTSTPPTSTAAATTSFVATATNTAPAASSIAGIIDGPNIGVGIPTPIVPYTAAAPFMQKSDLPEGTVFIGVGAVLAFLGACVLLWRGLVAWGVNRGVKRGARASTRHNEKSSTWGPSGYGGKSSLYHDHDAGSSMSLDALTSAGKHIKDPNAAHHRVGSAQPPPAGLFFSPTAQTTTHRAASPALYDSPNRGASYLPAGYYASPSADRPANGASTTTLGHPYARHSALSPSPPDSPDLPATAFARTSRDALRPTSALRNHTSSPNRLSRDGYGPSSSSAAPPHSNVLYAQPSTSSLMVGAGAARLSSENLPGSRAPSAYLEDLFENHGNGPRERF